MGDGRLAERRPQAGADRATPRSPAPVTPSTRTGAWSARASSSTSSPGSCRRKRRSGRTRSTTGLDRIGGAFDFPRDRIIIVPTPIQTRIQLNYTLAHELTHALENQHFNLHLGTLTAPARRAAVHRAVIEGTATLRPGPLPAPVSPRRHPDRPADRGNAQRDRRRARAPYAINAQAIFDYVDGALFVRTSTASRRLAAGGPRAAGRRRGEATRSCIRRSWPGGERRRQRVRLGVARAAARALATGRRRDRGRGAGAGRSCSRGRSERSADAGASGWGGGTVRRVDGREAAREDCERDCAAGRRGRGRIPLAPPRRCEPVRRRRFPPT